METPRQSIDVPAEVFEALNKLILSAIRQTWEGFCKMEEYLASDPLLFKTLSCRSCPLQTQFYFWVLARKTDDLASDPLLFKTFSSQSCPLQTQFHFWVLARQTGDFFNEINKMRHEFGPTEGLDSVNEYPLMHTCSISGLIHILKLILVYESGSNIVCLLKDEDGNTPLHCVAQTEKVSVINTLLETCWECAGLVSNKKNETDLHCALNKPIGLKNKAKALKTLLEWYIIKEEFLKYYARDWECGDTTLDLLIVGSEKILKELLGQKDSKICFQREFQEGNDYFVVIKCKEKESMGTSFKYRDYIREVTSKTTNQTILSLSVDSRSIITLKFLIRSAMVKGIFDIKDVHGNTVFNLLHKTEK